jgi:hypothetical protein
MSGFDQSNLLVEHHGLSEGVSTGEGDHMLRQDCPSRWKGRKEATSEKPHPIR